MGPMNAMTDQELTDKLATLDARDKILRQNKSSKQIQLNQASSYVGTCNDMCPERERFTRFKTQMSIFERDNNNQPDEFRMVKEYRRAGADQEEPLPHDLRTLDALRRTVDYLIHNVMEDPRSGQANLALDWYDFLWDRLRAIRKDITQQNICEKLAAILVERCTRFHIHSCYFMNQVKDFDINMNKKILNDCLQMLRQIYNDLKINGVTCGGEVEFQKYDILLHIGEDLMATNVMMASLNNRCQTEDMDFIIKIFNSYTNNDYYTFFKLMKQADYMTSCILALYVNKVRLNAMSIILTACPPKITVLYPAELIISTLGFDDMDDLKTFLSHLAIEVQEKNSKQFVVLKKDIQSSIRGKTLPPIKSEILVASKMGEMGVGQLVCGKPIPLEETSDLSVTISNITDQPDYSMMTTPNETINEIHPTPLPTIVENRRISVDKPSPRPHEFNSPVIFQAADVISTTDAVAQPESPKLVIASMKPEELPALTVRENSPDLVGDEEDEERIEWFGGRVRQPLGVEEVANMMPVGKMRRSKRVMARFKHSDIPYMMNDEVKRAPKRQSIKRMSDIEVLKEALKDEDNANRQFFKIVKMII